MKIVLGTDVTQREEFAAFLVANGIDASLGDNVDDVIDGVVVGNIQECGSLQNDIFQSRWVDFQAGKINSLPDGVEYIYYTYRTFKKIETRFFTKPAVAITFDSTGSAVILGRAESVPHSNAAGKDYENALIAAVEKECPSIQAYIQYRAHAPLVTMSRTAQRVSGLSISEMEDLVERKIRELGA